MRLTPGAIRGLAYLGLVLTALFWAGNAVVGRGIGDAIPPVALSFWRWLIALAIILPFGALRTWKLRAAIREQWLLIFSLSALSVAIFNVFFYLATRHTFATNVGLLNSCMPIMVALLSWLLLGARPDRRRLAGIGCALVGVLIIIAQGQVQNITSLSLQIGDLYMLAAVLLWSFFTVILKRHPVNLPALEFLTVQILFGVLTLIPLYLLELVFWGGFELRGGLAWPLIYVAIFPGLLAYGLWNFAVQHLGPQSAAMAAYLVPLFVALLAWWFLNETPALYHAAGAAFVLSGVFLATQRRSALLPKS